MLTQLLGNRGKDLGRLFETSMKLFGDQGVRDPSLRRFRLSLFNHCIVTLSVLFLFYDYHAGLGVFLLSTMFFVLLPYSFFYTTRMKACQAWLVYGSITQRKATFQDALEVTKKQKWTLRLFAFLELLISTRSRGGESNQNSGILAGIARIFLSALETVFDVAEDYLLPATVIEQKSLRDTIGKLEQLKTNIPASLSGAFGIDLFGGAISSLTFLVHFGILVVGAGMGFLLAPFMPQNLVTVVSPSLVQTFSFIPNHIFMLPLIVAIGFSSLLHRTLKIMVASLKNVYFSVFYVSINRPLEIREDLRDGLTNYLKLEDRSYLQTAKTQLANKLGNLSKGPTSVQKTDAQVLAIIEAAFRDNVAKGHSPEAVADFLKKKGYPDQEINQVMAKYRRSA